MPWRRTDRTRAAILGVVMGLGPGWGVRWARGSAAPAQGHKPAEPTARPSLDTNAEPASAEQTAGPSLDANAEPASAGAAGAEPGAEPTTEILRREASERLEAGDPRGAIVRLERALDQLEPQMLRREPDLRALLLYDLARAHDDAYRLQGDPDDLQRALALLQRLVEESELHGYAAPLVDLAVAARARLEDRLLAAQEEALSRSPPTGALADDAARSSSRPGRNLQLAGLSLVGLGVASSSLWITGVVRGRRAQADLRRTTLPSQIPGRAEALERGAAANRLVVAGTITAGVLVTVGLAVLVAGVVRGRRARSPRLAGGLAREGRR